MGVDASYVYGYMAKLDEIEWDIEYLKNNFKLDQDVIKAISKDDEEDVDYDDVDLDDLEETGLKYAFVYDDQYLYFAHQELAKKFPDRKLGELDELAKEYAKQCGVKNTEVFTWDEFGYFD